MIHLERMDSMSIWLTLVHHDLELLADAFRKALRGESGSIGLHMDMSVVTMKRKSKSNRVEMIVEVGSETRLSIEENQVKWTIESEDLDTAIDQLERSRTERHVFPAEFMRVQVPKNKRLDYIYCKLIDTENEGG